MRMYLYKFEYRERRTGPYRADKIDFKHSIRLGHVTNNTINCTREIPNTAMIDEFMKRRLMQQFLKSYRCVHFKMHFFSFSIQPTIYFSRENFTNVFFYG